jgi:NAD(P)-dependent dehydrogenase (short-subunit alcohol dehydrogenase family)
MAVYSDHKVKPDRPLDQKLEIFSDDMKVNITSPWMIAGEAVKGFEELGHGMFIQVGNLFSRTAGTGFLSFGMQKAAAAHMIQYLALLLDKPYRSVPLQVSRR